MFLAATSKLRVSFEEWKKERKKKKKEQLKWQKAFLQEHHAMEAEEKKKARKAKRRNLAMLQAGARRAAMVTSILREKRNVTKGRKKSNKNWLKDWKVKLHALRTQTTSLSAAVSFSGQDQPMPATVRHPVSQWSFATKYTTSNATTRKAVVRYKCVDPKGVAFRNSPSANDRSDGGVYPGQIVTAKSTFGNWIMVSWQQWLPKKIVWDDGRAAMVKLVESKVAVPMSTQHQSDDESDDVDAADLSTKTVAGGGLRAIRQKKQELKVDETDSLSVAVSSTVMSMLANAMANIHN